jgi:hypothetical protein
MLVYYKLLSALYAALTKSGKRVLSWKPKILELEHLKDMANDESTKQLLLTATHVYLPCTG